MLASLSTLAAFALASPLAPVQTTIQDARIVWSLPGHFRDTAPHDGGIIVLENHIWSPPNTGPLVQKISGTGEVLWDYVAPFKAVDLTVSTNGRVLLSGQLLASDSTFLPPPNNANGRNFGVMCLDADGNELWRRRVLGGLSDNYVSCAADASGGIYVAGNSYRAEYLDPYMSALAKTLLVHLDSDGNELWQSVIPGPFPNEWREGVGTMGSAPDGTTWLTATSYNEYGDNVRDRLHRFSPSGQLISSANAPVVGGSRFAFNAEGAVLMTGSYYGFGWSTADPVITLRSPGGGTFWSLPTGCFWTAGWLNDDRSSVVGLADSSLVPCAALLSSPDRCSLMKLGANGVALEQFVILEGTTSRPLQVEPDGIGGAYVSYTDPAGPPQWILARVANLDPIAAEVCTGQPNSTAEPARIGVAGSDATADNNLTLFVEGLPAQSLTLFLFSFDQGFAAHPAGSQGNLCLAGNIGRFSQIGASSSEGRIAIQADLNALPLPSGTTGAVPGQTAYFQAWYRDANPGSVSNFSSATEVHFQ